MSFVSIIFIFQSYCHFDLAFRGLLCLLPEAVEENDYRIAVICEKQPELIVTIVHSELVYPVPYELDVVMRYFVLRLKQQQSTQYLLPLLLRQLCHELGIVPLVCDYPFHAAKILKLYNNTTELVSFSFPHPHTIISPISHFIYHTRKHSVNNIIIYSEIDIILFGENVTIKVHSQQEVYLL